MKLDKESLLTMPLEDLEEFGPYFALLSCQLAESKRKGKFTIPISYTNDTIILHSGLKDWILDRKTFLFVRCIDPEGIQNGRIQ